MAATATMDLRNTIVSWSKILTNFLLDQQNAIQIGSDLDTTTNTQQMFDDKIAELDRRLKATEDEMERINNRVITDSATTKVALIHGVTIDSVQTGSDLDATIDDPVVEKQQINPSVVIAKPAADDSDSSMLSCEVRGNIMDSNAYYIDGYIDKLLYDLGSTPTRMRRDTLIADFVEYRPDVTTLRANAITLNIGEPSRKQCEDVLRGKGRVM